MRVVGTAGHVDHGKSSLVKALTGIEPDRLAEEQARKLTIDLGFAWLTLPNGETIGIVDVPGHEDFIENMLAGVGGIDIGLLVIAADEGVMPQTREHFAILKLLEIPHIIVVLTKIDLVDDAEWLTLVELDIHELLEASPYADAPLVRVSARTGEGIDALVQALLLSLETLPPKFIEGTPILPIDRVFTKTGFGTIVTGTLIRGILQVGDYVEIQPNDIQGRVRGLQQYQKDVDVAYAGGRVAVNISGIEHKSIMRGDVLTFPETLHSTKLADVELHCLLDAPYSLKHNMSVKVFVGTAECMARVRLLFDDELRVGQSGYAQLLFERNVPLLRYQRFIIRIPSPPTTIGGGIILDVGPRRKWKRQRSEVKARFERLSRGQPIDLLIETLSQVRYPITIQMASAKSELAEEMILALIDHDDIVYMPPYLIHSEVLFHYQKRALQALQDWHAEHPMMTGMRPVVLQERLGLEHSAFGVILEWLILKGSIVQEGDFLRLPDFQVTYTKTQQNALRQLEKMLSQNLHMPPSIKEATALVGEDVFESLLMQGVFI
ncbi:MAG: selenocysteine-specific translation elongation factor, partial [Phototrophicales bacterium]